ncbi:MAG: O-succinylhomoserine sulfhydrylase [Saprospiraceae bacterium]|jgi:O-succinylhomoserine sulfhydrylase
MKDSTAAIRNQMERSQYREHSTPMFMTSSFVYDSAEQAEAMFAGEAEGYIYSRFSNPNITELINKMCSLEGTEAGVATASGMAAVYNTLAAHLESGDHVVAAKSLFGNSTYILKHILPKWGIETTFVDIQDREAWGGAFETTTKMVLIETPTNPGLELMDMKWLAELTHRHNALLVVDNCFATPILQKPILFGADIILHSATKWIDGQGRVLGGMVLGNESFITPIYDFIRRTGAALSPFNAWILSKSLETLEVRMDRHCSNALRFASEFESHNKVAQVIYPYLPSHPQHALAKTQMSAGGGIVSLKLKGGKSETFNFINALRLPSITANLGDARTIVTHPATTTHSKLSVEEQVAVGIHPSTIRISIGLEDISDIIEDFEQALNIQV